MQVVAVSGKRRSGKNTIANFLIEKGFRQERFATELYHEVGQLGFTPDQVEEHKEVIRPIMIAIGDARRHFDPDHYARKLVGRLPFTKSEHVVVTDLRFSNEAKLLRDWASITGHRVTLVRVERPDYVRNTPADYHRSECDLDQWQDWDMIVNANSGEIDKLERAATELTN